MDKKMTDPYPRTWFEMYNEERQKNTALEEENQRLKLDLIYYNSFKDIGINVKQNLKFYNPNESLLADGLQDVMVVNEIIKRMVMAGNKLKIIGRLPRKWREECDSCRRYVYSSYSEEIKLADRHANELEGALKDE